MRVLLIEGDKINRDATRELLRSYGHIVEVADSGGSGAARALEENYDAVVVGLGTSSCEGWQVARRLKHAGKTCPLIGVIAWADREHQLRAEAAGFDSIIFKPIDPEKFSEAFAPPDLQRLAKRLGPP